MHDQTGHELTGQKLSRRQTIQHAAALAAGSFLISATARAGDSTSPATQPAGAKLHEAINPQAYMLSEPVLIALDVDGYSRDLIVTSARDPDGKQMSVYVPSRSVRVFLADPSVDDFTRQGGIYWKFHDKPGQTQLKLYPSLQSPDGLLVMLVRDSDVVRCYTLNVDLRCRVAPAATKSAPEARIHTTFRDASAIAESRLAKESK